MIEIIKGGKKRFVMDCDVCDAKFSYEIDDVIGRTVRCPCCGEYCRHYSRKKRGKRGHGMKAVLISINPKWCKLIASGEKTVEVRKTKPKCKVPFKCYIYCTKGKPTFTQSAFCDDISNGKVVGEFVCDRVIGTCPWRLKGETGLCAKRTEEETNLPNNACLTLEEIEKYAGSRGRGIYAWHITDLVVYDEPRELSEFWTIKCTNKKGTCGECKTKPNCIKPITRPPQSWCYVEVWE